MTKLVITVQENKEGLIDIQYQLRRSKDCSLKGLSTVKVLKNNAFSSIKFKEELKIFESG